MVTGWRQVATAYRRKVVRHTPYGHSALGVAWGCTYFPRDLLRSASFRTVGVGRLSRRPEPDPPPLCRVPSWRFARFGTLALVYFGGFPCEIRAFFSPDAVCYSAELRRTNNYCTIRSPWVHNFAQIATERFVWSAVLSILINWPCDRIAYPSVLVRRVDVGRKSKNNFLFRQLHNIPLNPRPTPKSQRDNVNWRILGVWPQQSPGDCPLKSNIFSSRLFLFQFCTV